MIIGSVTTPPTSGKMQSLVIPQTPANMSQDDHQGLLKLDKWNNVNALIALYNKTKSGVFSVQVSKPGMEIRRTYIIEQIEFLLKRGNQFG